MKTSVFISAIFLILFSIRGQAQFGVKAGTNLSAAGSYGNSEDGESAGLKSGYQLGLFYTMDLSPSIDLMVELNYEARGTISKKEYSFMAPVVNPSTGTVLGVGEYSVNQEANSVQNYINLPILLKFGINKLKFYAGPNIGYMISAVADFDRTIDISLGGNSVGASIVSLEGVDWYHYDSFKQIFTAAPPENGDFLNRLEIGINVGVTLQLNNNIFADLRINQGLADTSNNNYDFSIYPAADFSFPSRGDADRNASIQLGVGYSF